MTRRVAGSGFCGIFGPGRWFGWGVWGNGEPGLGGWDWGNGWVLVDREGDVGYFVGCVLDIGL